MNVIEVLLLSIALAMDCFTVSLVCGIIQKRMGWQVWCMAILFGLFQALMPLAGWAIGGIFNRQIERYDHWIAFGVLAFIGCKMIWESKHREDRSSASFNPSNAIVLLTLSIATSIDAMAIGFTFWSMGISSMQILLFPLLSIGIFAAILSILGKYLGIKLGCRFDWPAEQWGGCILIFIGLKVLVQHLWA